MKNEIKSLQVPFTKLVLRNVKYLNVKGTTLKALEENIGKYPWNSMFGKVISKKIQTVQTQKKIFINLTQLKYIFLLS